MTPQQQIEQLKPGSTIIPMQFFGLGDVIWLIHMARYWQQQRGLKVLWPVMSKFVADLNRAYPDLHFIDHRSVNVNWNIKLCHPHNGALVVPLRWTYEITRVEYLHCMRNKYDYVGMDWTRWKENAMPLRDALPELELYKKVNPTDEPFVLVNKNFRTNGSGVVDIKPATDLKVIHMSAIPGYSLFDWRHVIERAAEVHTVSTSIIYLLELWEIPAHIYVRRPDEPDHRNYDYLLSKIHYLHP